MIFSKTFQGFLKKEMRQTLRDNRMRLLLFVVPLIQLILFTLALSNEIKNIRVAVQYDHRDLIAQKIEEHALASRFFLPAKTTGNDPYGWIENNQADVVIVTTPQGISARLPQGDAEFQLLIDSKSVLKAMAVENYIKVITSQVLKAEFPAAAPALKFEVRALYNPTLDTSVYMVPGLVCMLVCIVTILLTSMAISKEREVGTLETLISAPVKSWEILLGKTVPFIILGCIQIPLIICLAVGVFGLPLKGSVILLAIASVIFVITTVSIGTVISTIAKTQQQSMMGGFIFLFPSVLMSGLLFPIESMPWALRIVANINPLTHFIALLRNLMVKGTSLEFFVIHTIPLIIIAAVCATIALKKFKVTL